MMKKMNWIAVVIVTAGLMSSCGSSEQKDAAAEGTTEQAAVINTTHAYVCPMNCENSASMEPGLCPVCKMELVANPNYQGVAATTDTAAVAADTAAHAEEGHEGHNH